MKSITFSQIVKRNHWLSVKLTMLQLYPDQEQNIVAYELIFEQLREMDPVETQMQIVISESPGDEPGEIHYDVSGEKLIPDDEDKLPNSYAIEFTPWNEWLGMQISKSTLRDFNELEIISHCLYEMTFMGYDEKEIQEELSSLKDTVDEIQNLDEDEKKLKLKSLDDWMEELGKEEE